MFTFGSQLGYAARLISLSYFLWSIGEGLWLYIRPLYLENLGATPQQTGFALAMFGLGRVLPIFPLIALIDRVNPLRLMLSGWFCGLISIGLTALAPDWRVATVGMFIYGMSTVALIPANLYLALAFQNDPTRHPAITLHTLLTFSWAAACAGLVISPVIGGFLGEQLGLRAVFAFSSVWFVLSTIAIWYCPPFPLSDPHPDGRNYLGLLKQRRFVLLNGLFLIVFVAGPLGYSLAPRFLEEIAHFSTRTLGFFGMMTSIGATIWSLVLGQLAPRRGFLIGLILSTVTFAIFLLETHFVAAALAYFLYGAWFALRPLATSLIAQRVRPDQQGMGFVVIDLLYGIGGILGPLSAGALYTQKPNSPFTSALLLIGFALVASITLRHQRNLKSNPTYMENKLR